MIPEALDMTTSGWTPFAGGISVKTETGKTFSADKKLVISADSENNWQLVLSPDKSASIGYRLTTASGGVKTTEFTFSAASIDAGVSQDLGVIVADYGTDQKEGSYEDTITFHVEVTDAGTETTGNVLTLTPASGDVTVNDGYTLTGTGGANTHITVAAGATITSINDDESHQWAGITPLGNAIIILEGRNAVKGGYDDYPGIHIASGDTLTIKGSGSSGSCGNITITSGVTSVAATKDSSAPNSIGAGYDSSCTGVTIDPSANVTQK